MRTRTEKIRTIDELTEAEVEVAHQKYLAAGDEMAWDAEWRASLKAFEQATGISVTQWSMQPRLYEIAFPSEIQDLPCTGIRLRTWILNHWDWFFTCRKHYNVPKQGDPERKNAARRWHNARLTEEESSCPFTGYCGDEDLLDPLRKFLAEGFKADEAKAEAQRSTLADLLDDCVSSWLRAYAADDEDQQTLEHFKDMATANGWEFDESGEITR
jgi:hypothetical protein